MGAGIAFSVLAFWEDKENKKKSEWEKWKSKLP